MAGYTRTDTTNNIADGNIINATDLDNEFDGIQAAFNSSTGHNHDGTTGEGAPILVLGPTQDVVVGATAVTPKTTNTVDIGSSSLKFKDLFLAGNASIGGTLAVTGVATLTAQPILSSLTASRAVFTDGSKGLVSNAITGTGNVVMSASPTLTGTISAEALTTSSTVTLNGGTANGVAYLNGSKVLTTGSALTFDGTTLGVSSGGSTPALRILGSGANQGQLSFNSTDSYKIQGGPDYLAINFFTNGANRYSIDSLGVAIWSVGGSEQMRLTSTGLGIGTTSPASKLQIGSVGSTGYAVSAGLAFGDGTRAGAFNTDASGVTLYASTNLIFAPGSTEKARIDSSGNFGIGGTPSYKLDVRGTGSQVVAVRAATSGDARFLAECSGTNSGWMQYTRSLQALQWSANGGTQHLTLDSAGNLGLGGAPNAGWANSTVLQTNGTFSAISTDTASDGNLSLSWNAYATAANTWFYRNTGIAANRYAILQGAFRWYTAPSGTAGNAITFTQAMTLNASGFLGVGETSPTSRIHVNGTIQARTNATGIQIYGDGGTGYVNSVGAYPLVLQVNSTDRARIDTSGNLGLGVTPSAWWSSRKVLQLGNAGGSGGYGHVLTGTNVSYVELGANYYTDSTPADKYIATGHATRYYQFNGSHIWQNAASGTAGATFTFTQAMTLFASGGLAVGSTTDPGAGNIRFESQKWTGIDNNARYVADDAVVGGALYTGGGFRFFTAGANERMRLDSSGNLALGATSASYRLDITAASGNNGVIAVRAAANQNSSLSLAGNASTPLSGSFDLIQDQTQAYVYQRANQPLVFGTNNTERMRIDASGNVLVGTTASGGQSGFAVLKGGSGIETRIEIGHNFGTASGVKYADFLYATGTIGSITQSGTTAVLYNTTSDQRLKENIVDADDAASLIDALQVRQFDWKSDGSHQRYGFVAQELATVAPEAVHQPANPEDMMSVDYSKLVPILVKEIQSLRARLAAANI